MKPNKTKKSRKFKMPINNFKKGQNFLDFECNDEFIGFIMIVFIYIYVNNFSSRNTTPKSSLVGTIRR